MTTLPSQPAGALRGAHVEFLEWAGRYDTGGLAMRERIRGK